MDSLRLVDVLVRPSWCLYHSKMAALLAKGTGRP